MQYAYFKVLSYNNKQIHYLRSEQISKLIDKFLYSNSNNNQMSSYNSYYGYRSQLSSTNEAKIKDEKQLPLDTVKQIIWNHYQGDNTQSFFTCGWDGVVRYYAIENNGTDIKRAWEIFLQHPIMSITLAPNNILIAGLGSGEIVAVSMADNRIIPLGSHDAPICRVFWMEKISCLLSLGLDRYMKFWTLQQNNGSHLAMAIELPIKTHATAYSHPYLLIGACNQDYVVLNIDSPQNIKIPQRYFRPSGHSNMVGVGELSKYSCASIRAHPQLRYDFGTSDGRNLFGEFKQTHSGIEITSAKVSKIQKKEQHNHRAIKAFLGQVNDLELGVANNSTYLAACGTFEAVLYNMIASRNVLQLKDSKDTEPTTALKISPNGEWIVYATGNDWCYGIQSLEKAKRPRIYAKKISKNTLEELASKINR